MPATPIDEAAKAVLFRGLQVSIVPTINNIASPTRTELDAGTDVTAQLQALAGWTKTQAFLDANRVGSDVTVKVPGRVSLAESSLTTYEEDGQDVRETYEEGDVVFVCFFRSGDVAGHLYDVWPCQVGAISKSSDTEAIKMLTSSFGIIKTPKFDLTVPAHV